MTVPSIPRWKQSLKASITSTLNSKTWVPALLWNTFATVSYPQGVPSNHVTPPRQNTSSEDSGISLLKSCHQVCVTDPSGERCSLLHPSHLFTARTETGIRWWFMQVQRLAHHVLRHNYKHQINIRYELCKNDVKCARPWHVKLCFEWPWSLPATQSTFPQSTIPRNNWTLITRKLE